MGTHPPASALGSRLIQLESLHSVNWEIWFLYHPFLNLVSQQNYFHFLVCKHQAKSWIHWTCKKNYLSKLITENKNQQGPIPNFKLTLNTKNKLLSPSFWRKKPQPCEARQALFTVAAHGVVPVERNKYICKMWNVCGSLSLHIMWYVLMKESSWAGMCWATKLIPVSRTLWLRR